jgi:para-nitrobenzyl esterase
MTSVQERPSAKVAQGELLGVREQPDVDAFLGVPFAAPPVGELRWRPPQPPASWSGTRDASAFGPACTQLIGGESPFRDKIASAFEVDPPPFEIPYSEDCLYLNVYAPARREGGALPVMVWIHGGAFRFGTAAMYDPQHLVRKGVLVVTINYRLDVFGFLAHPELTAESPSGASGNYGLMDQIEALRWVQRNIAAFGGDPGNVTIFGESAGGQSVAQLVASPLSEGLFHRAIAQSGVGVHVRTKLTEAGAVPISAHDMGLMYQQQIGAGSLAALREIDAATLIEKAGLLPLGTNPIVDGHVFPRELPDAFERGLVQDVPFMLGSNADEGTALYWGSPMVEIPPPVDTLEKFRSGIRQAAGSQAEELLALYLENDDSEMLDASCALLGDSLFSAQAHYVARILAQREKGPYLYFFTQVPEGKAGELLGAFHASEISYVFGAPALNPIADPGLSQTMMDAWVQFARTGDPNGPGLPRWDPYSEEADEHMELGPHSGMRPVDRKKKFATLAALFDRLRS